MRKSKYGWLAGSAMVSALVLSACGGGGDEEAGGDGEETYDWRFVTEENEGQVQYEYAMEFAERLNEKSDGRINMDVFEFGGLGSEVDQVEQLQNGAVEFAIVSPGFTGTMVEEGQIFSLQFLLPDDQEVTHDLLNESEALNEDLAALYEENGILPLSFWTEGATQWTGNRELTEPEDFEGFRMRTQDSPLNQRSYEAYGADPTVMSAGDLYGAMQQGTVDGQENPIFFIQDSSYHEVQDYMTISNHNTYVAMTTVNPDFYNELPEDIQGMIDETVDEMRDESYALQERLNEELLTDIEENTDTPTEITELTEEQRDAFRELAIPQREFYAENSGDNAEAILEKLEEEIEEMDGGETTE